MQANHEMSLVAASWQKCNRLSACQSLSLNLISDSLSGRLSPEACADTATDGSTEEGKVVLDHEHMLPSRMYSIRVPLRLLKQSKML